jgi:hypothetical protein
MKRGLDNGTSSNSEYISTITPLKRKLRSDEALLLLQKVATLVKPLMKNHGFKIKTLTEFFPKDRCLLGLNVNHGMKICLRLRPAHDECSFLPIESLVETMLHELTHNKHGPHDANFYGFLDKLKVEYDKLLLSGYTGEGFFSEGSRVGVGVSHNVPLGDARKKAFDAAIKRVNSWQPGTGSAGRKLGALIGNSTKLNKNVELKKLKDLVREAAERRLADSIWCTNAKNGAKFSKQDLGMEDENENDTAQPTQKTRKKHYTTANKNDEEIEIIEPATISSNEIIVIDDDEDTGISTVPIPLRAAQPIIIDLT